MKRKKENTKKRRTPTPCEILHLLEDNFERVKQPRVKITKKRLPGKLDSERQMGIH